MYTASGPGQGVWSREYGACGLMHRSCQTRPRKWRRAQGTWFREDVECWNRLPPWRSEYRGGGVRISR